MNTLVLLPPPILSRSKKTTVLLVDDHAFVLQSLSSLLKTDGHIKVVGKARNGLQAVKMARALQPDVILMDIAMPVLDGLQATRQILTANPEAKVLILSAYTDGAYVECLMAMGAVGFLEKHTMGEYVTQAIQEVVNGNCFLSPTIAKRMARDKPVALHFDGLLKPNGVRRTPCKTKCI